MSDEVAVCVAGPAGAQVITATDLLVAWLIAATSSVETCALPSCATGTQDAPASGNRVPLTSWRAVSGWLASRPS